MSDAQELVVTEAFPMEFGNLLVTFSNGEKRIVDTTLLRDEEYLVLRDPVLFQTVTVEDGAVSWKDGVLTMTPEFLYENGRPFDRG